MSESNTINKNKEFKASHRQLKNYDQYYDHLSLARLSIAAAIKELKDSNENFVLVPGPMKNDLPTILIVSKFPHKDSIDKTTNNSRFFVYQCHINNNGMIMNFINLPTTINVFVMSLNNAFKANNLEVELKDEASQLPKPARNHVLKKFAKLLKNLFKGLRNSFFGKKHTSILTNSETKNSATIPPTLPRLIKVSNTPCSENKENHPSQTNSKKRRQSTNFNGTLASNNSIFWAQRAPHPLATDTFVSTHCATSLEL